MNAYEVHLGSWRKKRRTSVELSRNWPDRWCSMHANGIQPRRNFAGGRTRVLSVMGLNQVTGFYAPTSRYGTPEDFQFLVNALTEAGIGVIVDWVPAHFSRDDWALARFDGRRSTNTRTRAKARIRIGGTADFHFQVRHEVNNFLVANALFWCDRFTWTVCGGCRRPRCFTSITRQGR